MNDLVAFLQRMTETPFEYGQCDCMLMVAEWVKLRRGVDPAEGLRGNYSSASGYARLVAREGGLRACAEKRFGAVLRGTTIPKPGDVGLVLPADGVSGAIRVRAGWAMKAERGLVIADPPLAIAWRV